MKKLFLIISALLGTMCLSAQPTSLWLQDLTNISSYNVIKEWTGGIAIGACIDASTNCNALVQVPFTAAPSPTTTVNGLLLGDSIITVSDMWIIRDEVFFCGSATRTGKTVGYVGHTTVSTSGFSNTNFVTFDSTSYICSLAVFFNLLPPGGYRIVAIGRKPYSPASPLGKQYIIELSHNGVIFMPTAGAAYATAYLADEEIPEHITVTENYFAITGRIYNTNQHYFVIRCDKSTPVYSAQIYDFNDPTVIYNFSEPTIEHIEGDLVAVAYSSPVGNPHTVVVKTLRLSSMTEDNAQYFYVDTLVPSPRMAFFIADKKLVLLTSENMFPQTINTLSSFVYIDPFNISNYTTTLAYPSSTLPYPEHCYSIAKLGLQHFIGYSTNGWYLQKQPFSSLYYSTCFDNGSVQIQQYMKLSGVEGWLALGKLYGCDSSINNSTNYKIESFCPTLEYNNDNSNIEVDYEKQ
ncbi:MAG: hypothetical protein K5650_02715 [Bacteroidales bacterium]|nr:hypothetical protein [Bacteroidales bacterium]